MRFSVRTKRIGAIAAIVVVAAAIGGTVMSRAFAGGTSVRTAKAARKTLAVTLSVSGKTEADRKSDVFAPSVGTLTRVLVAEGQEVAAGQVLAEMDTDQLDAAVDAARTAYDGAGSQLEAIGAQVPSGAEIDAANAQVKSAKRAYDQACKAYKAAVTARSGEATISAAQTAKEQAYAGYLGAKAQLRRLSSAGDVGSRRKAAITGRDSAERGLERAEANRTKAILRAPIAGVVVFDAIGVPAADGSAPKATDGCSVSPASAVFTVVDMKTLRFTAQVDENDVARVRTGLTGVVTLDAAPGHDMTSTVSAIKPAATQTSNGAVVFPVALRIANGDESLRLGMSGNASIKIDDVTDAVAVPIEALVDDKDGQYVFVVVDGKLEKRTVTTGVMTETDVQVVKGLKPGDTVAIASGATLTDGMSVKAGGSR